MNKYKYLAYYQPNKKDIKDSFGDCVIRSLTKALDKEWVEVFDELVPIAREKQCMPNNKPAYETYILANGFEYVGISNKKGTTRPTVLSFTKEHKTGTYILNVANHLVTVKDGMYYDTWDCGWKCLYGYWVKK